MSNPMQNVAIIGSGPLVMAAIYTVVARISHSLPELKLVATEHNH